MPPELPPTSTESPIPTRSSRLARQVKRHLGIQNEQSELGKTLTKIKNAEPLDDTELKFVLGFQDFLTSIDSSYTDGDEKARMAVRNLEISSEELNSANSHLDSLNKKINAMLDGLGQGLLFFNKDGQCSDVFSKACLDIFETNPTNKHLNEILHLSPEQNDDLSMWLSIVFDESVPIDFNDLKNLAPQSYKNKKNQYIELDYRPLYISGNKIEGILCIATDRTFEISAKDELHRKEEEALRIRMIASNRNEFQRYIACFDDYAAFLESQKTKLSDMASLIMHLHNFKGMSGVFHFDDLVKTIHRMENMVKSENFEDFISDLNISLPFIREQKNIAIEIGTLLFGDDFIESDSVVSMAFDKLNSFREILKTQSALQSNGQSLLKVFDTLFLTTPIADCFKTFHMELDRVTTSQNKPSVSFNVNDSDIVILPKTYAAFFDSLMHLARNIVDHGIEPPDERLQKSKTEQGNVTINAHITDSKRLHISILDDGRGLSFEAIRDKLDSTGKYDKSETPEQTIQHIFDSDFTTKSHASILSGRGVGMYAVKQEVEKIGGHVSAKNITGKIGGAQFDFDLPLYAP